MSVTVFVTVGTQIVRILSRLDRATSGNPKQRETTKPLARCGVSVVRSCTVLTDIAGTNGLWEQDVGGSNPLALTRLRWIWFRSHAQDSLGPETIISFLPRP